MASLRAQWVRYRAESYAKWQKDTFLGDAEMDEIFRGCGGPYTQHDHTSSWCGIFATHLLRLEKGEVYWDIVDRGDDSRAAMDLLMRLEPQASAAGGRVHDVLGNHEIMNMVSDLRYVAKGEFAAFAAEEPAARRDAAYARLAQTAPSGQPALTRAEFDARFPAGFFAHRAAFVVASPDEPAAQAGFATARGWRFPMVSDPGSSFATSMGYVNEEGLSLPGLSVFQQREGQVVRVSAVGSYPLDDLCVFWHLLELLPQGAAGWVGRPASREPGCS